MADMPMTWSGARGAYSVDKFLQEVKSWSMLRKSQVAKPLTSSNVLHHIMQRLLNSALWARFDHALNSNAFVADGQAGNVASREEHFDLAKLPGLTVQGVGRAHCRGAHAAHPCATGHALPQRPT